MSKRPQVVEPETKLRTIRRAVLYSFPTADIKQLLGEIEQGCQQDVAPQPTTAEEYLEVPAPPE